MSKDHSHAGAGWPHSSRGSQAHKLHHPLGGGGIAVFWCERGQVPPEKSQPPKEVQVLPFMDREAASPCAGTGITYQGGGFEQLGLGWDPGPQARTALLTRPRLVPKATAHTGSSISEPFLAFCPIPPPLPPSKMLKVASVSSGVDRKSQPRLKARLTAKAELQRSAPQVSSSGLTSSVIGGTVWVI